MDVDEGPVHHLLSADSIKMMGESVGVSNLNEDAAMRLSEDLEFRFTLQKLLFKIQKPLVMLVSTVPPRT